MERRPISRLIIISNRVSTPKARGDEVSQGGLAVALSAALRQLGGIWLGWSGETITDFSGTIRQQSADGVTTATIDLEPQDIEEYYNGYANRTLWPLFHYRLDLVEFDLQFGEGYERVNDRFAAAAASLVEQDDLVWIHDYHFIPLAQRLRRLGIENRIGFFLHIPWPPEGLLATLPFHDRLVESILAYDVIGFQTSEWLDNFVQYLNKHLGIIVDDGGVAHCGDRSIKLGVYPIGIDSEQLDRMLATDNAAHAFETVKRSAGDRKTIIGVDRLDYSKGLIERFNGYRQFLEDYPGWLSRAYLLQIAPPSRGEVQSYESIRQQLDELSGRINGQFAHVDWVPIRYVNQSYPRDGLAGFYRASDVALITPLRDGMNLVAKEYVGAQDPDNPGVLILSRFAGAAESLTSAILVNPFSRNEISNALHLALTMQIDERRRRWQQLNEAVRRESVGTWRDRFLIDLQALDQNAPLFLLAE
jgi:trehalose 6-phosphate synthase